MSCVAPGVRSGTAHPQAGAYRVLMIAPTSFFADYGCHVRILEEARILQRLGSQVTICTYHNGRDLPDLDIRRTLSIPWRRGYEVGSSRHKIAFDALLVLRACTAMWQVRPQIIHAHLHEGALIGALLSRLWGVPLVFDFQGSMTAEMVDHHFLAPASRYYKPLRRLEQRIDRVADRILTSSTHAAALLAQEFNCPHSKITCLPDCVNTEVFRRSTDQEDLARFKRELGIPVERTVVAYLGKLAAYQGTDHLLEAARIICARRNDVHFLVAGYPYVEHYSRLAADLGIAQHVTFTGQVHYEEAPRLLSIGDIAVSPKLSRTEGAGKLLNYMAVELPTVAFDTEVSREFLGENGVYAARGDSVDLARCLEELVAAPAHGRALGAALRQRAQEHFAWEHAGQAILQVYAALLA